MILDRKGPVLTLVGCIAKRRCSLSLGGFFSEETPSLPSTSHSGPDKGDNKAGKDAHCQCQVADSHVAHAIAQIFLAAEKRRLGHDKSFHHCRELARLGTSLLQEIVRSGAV